MERTLKVSFVDRILDYFENHVKYSLSITRKHVYDQLEILMPFCKCTYKEKETYDNNACDVVSLNFGDYKGTSIIINFYFNWELKTNAYWKLINISKTVNEKYVNV